jgi:hypothetical protein
LAKLILFWQLKSPAPPQEGAIWFAEHRRLKVPSHYFLSDSTWVKQKRQLLTAITYSGA